MLNVVILKKWPVFGAGYLSEAPSPPMTIFPPPPPYALYMCIQYTYSHREGGGGEAKQKG